MRPVVRARVGVLALAAAVSCSAATEGSGRPTPRNDPSTGDSIPPVSAPPREPTFRDPGGFSARAAMRHVRVLAARIGPRPAGSRAHRRAARYIEGRLDELGYDARVERFGLGHGRRAENVVARARRPELVVGAHLDTVPSAPGGNDNASGVAVMLEVARALAGTRFEPRLTFVAFGAEELQPDGTHHVGSEDFVDDLQRRERSRIRGMVSVDMIGKAAPIVTGTLDERYRRLVRTIVRVGRRIAVRTHPRVVGDVSDHGPFAAAGIPAVLLWTGHEPEYHSPRDVASNVDPAALRNAGRVVLGVVRSLLRR